MLLALAIVTGVASTLLLYRGTMIGQDSATQFYPWYDYLGERLRAGEIPGWNPYQFAGAPFAADPQSGWTYLPAMLVFTLLPLSLAVPVFLVGHLTLAGFGTYALARVLKILPSGAFVAAVAYQLSGPILGRSVCCPAALEVASWFPIALLGAELAIRQPDWTRRTLGWVVAGLAVSQALAAWLGQGAYYLLLGLGAFVVYRTLLVPQNPARRMRSRLVDVVLHGSVILTIGFGLAAAGVAPRLDYVARSNVAGGEYQEQSAWAAEIGGVTPGMIADRFFEPSLHYPGTAVLALAIAALWLSRGWFAMRYFAGFGIAALVLATPWTTPLHLLLYTVLPRFEELHRHWPERVAVVGYLAFAMLAGAAVDTLVRRRLSRGQMLAVVGVPLVGVAAQLGFETGMPVVAIGSVLLAVTLAAVIVVGTVPALRLAIPGILAVAVAVDLLLGFDGIAGQAPYGGFHRVDVDAYFAPTGAVETLRKRGIAAPGRYIGFDQDQRAIADGQMVLYRYQFASPETGALLVNNRGTLHGLEDAQGYNPVQPMRFVEYLTALNGRPQEYHDANVYPVGLNSPLLDLLHVRYIIVPTEDLTDGSEFLELNPELTTIYEDEQIHILENLEALPRAWIVHEARQVAPGDALTLLSSGEVDGRRVALLETEPPELRQATDASADRVTMLDTEPETLRMATSTDAPGLLVVSDSYDPGWRAYVDGERTPVLVADHLLRAVSIPAGNHIVEFRYEPQWLQVGIAVSTATIVVTVVPMLVLGWQALRRGFSAPNARERGWLIPAGAPDGD